ncbi:MAG: hypothetical protein NT004_16590, partial [Bacteroidetes bacterium]|nr:hypothetical protein [Bacteroidota bacterium]
MRHFYKIKTQFAVAICSLILIGLSMNAKGQLPFSDGFESGNFTTGGWTVTGNAEISTQYPAQGTYCVKGPGTYSIEKSFTNLNENIIAVEYAMKASQTGSNCVTFTVKDENDSTSAIVFFRHTGYIEAYNGYGNNQQISLNLYNANTWYNMKIVLDISLKTYDVFINGQLTAADFSFHNAGFTMPKKFSWGSGETWGTGWVDAVNIFSPVSCDSIIALAPSTITQNDLDSLMLADGISQSLISDFQGTYAYKITVNAGGGYYTDTKMRLCLNGVTPISGIAKGISDDTEVNRTQIGLDPGFTDMCSFNELGWVGVDTCTGGNPLYMRLNSKWGSNIDTYIYYWVGTNQPIDALGYSLLDNFPDDFGSITVSAYSVLVETTCDSAINLIPSTITQNDLESLMLADGISQSLISDFQGTYAYKITVNAGGGYYTDTKMRLCL